MVYFLQKGWRMSNGIIVYEGTLSNGIKYHVHQSSGFSNKCDIAINIGGEFVAILTVIPKRNGNIETIPMNLGKMLVINPKTDTIEQPDTTQKTPNNPSEKQIIPDLLSDVIPEKINDQENNNG